MFIENERERFIVARWSYLAGEPILSDIEYDALERSYKAKFPEDEYSNRGWSFDPCPEELLRKYGLSHMIFNTTMGYAAESIYSVNSKEEYERTFRSLNSKSRLSFKIDGWNDKASYYNGYLVNVQTRGRSGSNLNVSSIAKLFPRRIPIMGRVAVTGELSIPNDKWVQYKIKTGNSDQRASVRTAIANGDVDYLSFLAFNIFIEDNNTCYDDPYEMLKSLGFKTPYFKWVNNYDELTKMIDFMSNVSKKYNYLTDGLVIENSSMQLAIRLGAWEEVSRTSYVVGYSQSQGMYGVSMIVDICPVVIEGKTITKISINNIANIVENGLEPGSPIAFDLRSAANSVINVSLTNELQKKWDGRYGEYCSMIREREGR